MAILKTSKILGDLTITRKLGVGTSAPESPLHVVAESSDTEMPEGMLTLENTKSSGESSIRFINSNVDSGSAWYCGLNNGDSFRIGYGTSNTNSNTKLEIKTDGTVIFDGITILWD
jgi:hypothetical protein